LTPDVFDDYEHSKVGRWNPHTGLTTTRDNFHPAQSSFQPHQIKHERAMENVGRESGLSISGTHQALADSAENF
jgi:hypothetical protein